MCPAVYITSYDRNELTKTPKVMLSVHVKIWEPDRNCTINLIWEAGHGGNAGINDDDSSDGCDFMLLRVMKSLECM